MDWTHVTKFFNVFSNHSSISTLLKIRRWIKFSPPPPVLSSLGLNSLNFLLPAGQPPASLALPPSSVPTLAVPYVLVPSAALSHYPLVAGGLQQQGPDAHAKLSFGLPAVMSPAHFTVGAAPYGMAAASEISWSSLPTPSTPEQSRLYGSAGGAPHSPSRPLQTISISAPDPLVRNELFVCIQLGEHTEMSSEPINSDIVCLHNDA